MSCPFGRFGRDGAASAPFAVVAVVILLGAGMSYAYLASYRSAKEAAGDRAAWADGPQAALDAEQARVESAVRDALDEALDPSATLPSGTLVATIGAITEQGFLGWVGSSYPRMNGRCARTVRDARLVVVPVYGRVMAGNALGQQTDQWLPVGVEAVAAATVGIDGAGQAALEREVTFRVDRPCPMLLAAHLQNVLEYELAEDGLVPTMMADALSCAMSADGSLYPTIEMDMALLNRTTYAVERSLFRGGSSLFEASYDAVPVGDEEILHGGGLMGLPGNGGAAIEIPLANDFTLTFPPTGEDINIRLAPSITGVHFQSLEATTDQYIAAEATGHANATAVRMTYGTSIGHRVDCYLDGTPAGSVERAIESRSSVTAWAWDRPRLDLDGDRPTQVEDWSDFEAAMDIAGSAPRSLSVTVGTPAGAPMTVALDGVCLGECEGRDLTLRNVAVGLHDLFVQTGAATCMTTVEVCASAPSTSVRVLPQAGQDDVEDFTFWFPLMASYHGMDGSRVPYLDFLARLSGYPPAPAQVSSDPEGHIGELVFWEEGLSRHLELAGRAWTAVDGPVKGSFWQKASDVLYIYNLAHKVLYKLPKEIVREGRICVMLGSADGRERVTAYLRSQNDQKILFDARSTPQGFVARFGSESPVLLASFRSGMALLSVATSAYSVCKDVIEVGRALEDGSAPETGLAVLRISIDIVKTVFAVINLLKELGLFAVSEVLKGCMGLVSAAFSVATAFMSAYKEAGGDLGAALGLLVRPESFSDAMRTAGFVSGIATLTTAAVLGLAVPGVALASAAAMATGVGLIVLGVVLAAWAIINWDSVQAWLRGWVSGTATQSEVDAVKDQVVDMLNSTMHLRAKLNAVDVAGELRMSRLERGSGLALMGLRSLLPSSGLAGAIGRSDLKHLDDGSSLARRAKSVAELRYWVEVLWREVDDFVDEDDAEVAGGLSEGFADDKGALGFDHDFDADILVTDSAGLTARLSQGDGSLVGFLRGIGPDTVEGTTVRLELWGKDGRVYGPALEEWDRALEAICGEVGRCVDNVTVASREAAYAAMTGAGIGYSRELSIVEVRTGEGLQWSQVDVIAGGIMVDGRFDPRGARVGVSNGSRMLVVSQGPVQSWMVCDGLDLEELETLCTATAPRWCDPDFGRTVLDHRAVVKK